MGKHDVFTLSGLTTAIELKNRINSRGGEARVGIVYFDLGQDWTWETVICKSKGLVEMDFQLLTPRDFKEMNNDTFDRYDELIERALK
ncbi:hypothetical protein ABD87_14825 [Lysinibacillus sphaericus]|uniref:hypothetical protein n=1 Tax=Lysinibacillus sphaericus TaxID=1421 RepID=UPI0018CE171B|nr:hypothetical protein [Lysinibacillus sphaericus]MBG9730770.1 hypothetical protein [Lysinibacillus sphaericus]